MGLSSELGLRVLVCRYVDALVSLMPLVLGLHDQLKTAAQDGDMETSHGICRIAVALGETHSRYPQINMQSSVFSFCFTLFMLHRVLLKQLDHWQEYLALVNMILFCTGIPGHYPVSETTSSLTLTFWYSLQVQTLQHIEERKSAFWDFVSLLQFLFNIVIVLILKFPGRYFVL